MVGVIETHRLHEVQKPLCLVHIEEKHLQNILGIQVLLYILACEALEVSQLIPSAEHKLGFENRTSSC